MEQDDAADTGNGPVDGQAGFEQLLQQFDALLREDAGLDQPSRESLLRQYGEALEEADADADVLASLPGRGAWMDAVQALQESGAVAEDEANELVRRLDHALQPLQRRESQLAIEFTRRMQADGEAEALAWFRDQAAKAADARQSTALSPPPRAPVAPIGSEVVNSRSRRLRGPPRQR